MEAASPKLITFLYGRPAPAEIVQTLSAQFVASLKSTAFHQAKAIRFGTGQAAHADIRAQLAKGAKAPSRHPQEQVRT